MNFDLDSQQLAIKRSAREMLAERCALPAVRAAAESGSYDPALWDEMVSLGWPGIAIAEEYGGIGLGLVELTVLLEEAGYALAPSGLLSTVAAARVIEQAGSAAQREAWLPRLAAGEVSAALAVGDGTLVADAQGAAVIVVIDSDLSASLLAADEASISPVDTIDPTRRFALVSGAGEPLEGPVLPGFSDALVAVAAELTGVCQRALDLTVAYVKERQQFGVPVGAFQAVSHRCAEMLLATEGSRSATYAAAWAADAEDMLRLEYALSAKAAASDAGIEVTAAAIQAHGGIGFTWDADVHWFYKRALLDAQLIETASQLRARLVRVLGERLAVV